MVRAPTRAEFDPASWRCYVVRELYVEWQLTRKTAKYLSVLMFFFSTFLLELYSTPLSASLPRNGCGHLPVISGLPCEAVCQTK